MLYGRISGENQWRPDFRASYTAYNKMDYQQNPYNSFQKYYNQGNAKRNDKKKRRENKGQYKSLGFRLNLGEIKDV